MNKKLIIISVLVLVLCIVAIILLSSKKDTNENLDQSNNVGSGKILVVYFSAQNHTKAIAEKIAQNLNADIFEIVPEDEYTIEDLDWTNDQSRVSKEHENEDLRNVKLISTNIDNWDNYDTILIGYPIWWGIAAWPVNTFVEANDFSGKTVIPFCTSVSSGIGQSGELLENVANGGTWLEGYRFSSNASDLDIEKFTDSLK